jgi:penicillin-binding protein A
VCRCGKTWREGIRRGRRLLKYSNGTVTHPYAPRRPAAGKVVAAAMLLLLCGGLAAGAAQRTVAQADPVPGGEPATAEDAGQPQPEAQAKGPAQPKQDSAAQANPSASGNDSEETADDERAIESAVSSEEGKPDGGAPDHPAEVNAVPATAANAVAQHASHLEGLTLWRKAKLSGTGDAMGYFADSPDGKHVRISVEPALQKQMVKLFRYYRPMQGALVAIDPKTGKVLALVEYAKDGKSDGLAVKPLYPAASVFKIITGAALLEAGVSPDAETCYHGGLRGIVGRLLEDKPHMDRRCMSLSMALAKSANVVFAKMAVKHLDGESLRKAAERFLFNRPIWDVPVEASPADIPDGKLDLAKSAAGFGKVKLSPLHAALIAAAVGNGGIAFEPSLIEEVDGVAFKATESSRLLKEETAAALRDMMKYTVTEGTATSSFRERGRSVLGDIAVAGKTGSLSNHKRPYMDYSWFVGFAPADDPKIAVAAVVVNGLKWRIHAPYVAREAFREYLVGGTLGQPPVARVHRRHRRHR